MECGNPYIKMLQFGGLQFISDSSDSDTTGTSPSDVRYILFHRLRVPKPVTSVLCVCIRLVSKSCSWATCLTGCSFSDFSPYSTLPSVLLSIPRPHSPSIIPAPPYPLTSLSLPPSVLQFLPCFHSVYLAPRFPP